MLVLSSQLRLSKLMYTKDIIVYNERTAKCKTPNVKCKNTFVVLHFKFTDYLGNILKPRRVILL
jgi:hypothetical protein